MPEITIDVRGCDNNTAVKLDVCDEDVVLLKQIARAVNALKEHRVCAPSIFLYEGDALSYERADDPEFPDWKSDCLPSDDGAEPDGDICWERCKEIPLDA